MFAALFFPIAILASFEEPVMSRLPQTEIVHALAILTAFTLFCTSLAASVLFAPVTLSQHYIGRAFPHNVH